MQKVFFGTDVFKFSSFADDLAPDNGICEKKKKMTQ